MNRATRVTTSSARIRVPRDCKWPLNSAAIRLKDSGTTSRSFGRGLMHSLILLSCVSTFTFALLVYG